MRVVFVLNSSGLYGANRSLLGLMEFLCKKGNKCFAVLPEAGDIEKELHKLKIEYIIETYRPCVWFPGYIGAPFLINLIHIPRIIRQIKKWDVDLIHTNSSSHDIGMLAARYLKKKHIWHIREIMEEHYQTKNIFPHIYKSLRAKSDAVICVSKYVFDYNMKHYPNKNMKMIYNPYDIAYYDISRPSFAQGDMVTILLAGTLTKDKNTIDSIKAIKLLADKGIRNIKLILAGDSEKEYFEELTSYICDNHLEKWIEYMGFTADLRAARKSADIALCCSTCEALPRVVVEGMLGELLVIGADSGGIAELLEHGNHGLLYEPGNYGELADRIEYALSHKAKCRKIIREAKQYAIDNFDLNRSGEKILNVYNELTGKKKQ